MRFLVEVSFPTEAGNRALQDPKFLEKLEHGLKSLNAEASYFCEKDGERTANIVVSFANPDMIPVVAEPFFQDFGARVKLYPVMLLDDLKRGVAQWQALARKEQPVIQ